MFLQEVVTGRPSYPRWRIVGDVYGADLRILNAVLAMHHGSLSRTHSTLRNLNQGYAFMLTEWPITSLQSLLYAYAMHG